VTFVVGRPAAQRDDEIHVLGDGIGAEPAHLHYSLMLEEGESSRDNHGPSQPRPAVPSRKEAAQVFHNLKALQGSCRESQFNYLAVSSRTSIDDSDDTAADDSFLWRPENGIHQSQKRVALQDAIRVQAAEIRGAAEVDPRIQCISLATPLFVNYQEIGDVRIKVKAAHGGSGKGRVVTLIQGGQLESSRQSLQ